MARPPRKISLPALKRAEVFEIPPGTAPEGVRQGFVGKAFELDPTPGLAHSSVGNPGDPGGVRVNAEAAMREVAAADEGAATFFAPALTLHQSGVFVLPQKCCRIVA